jgi:Mrp family chromosome partitioning ATPase
MSEISQGQIITFYSYKGGTGRTMALANVAWILARNGKRVLAVDGNWNHRVHSSSIPSDESTVSATPG